MAELDVLQAAYDRMLTLVDQVGPEDLSRPTPCADWDVRALLAHVVAGQDGLVAMVRGEQPDFERDALGEEPAAALRRSLQEAQAAWAEPGAIEKPSQQMAGMHVVDFAMADAVVHCWDLASALGQPVGLDDGLAQQVLDRWPDEVLDTGRKYDAFGPRVEVADDAPAVDRLVAGMGRDPQWRS